MTTGIIVCPNTVAATYSGWAADYAAIARALMGIEGGKA